MAKWVLACQPPQIVDPAVGFGILLEECRIQGFTGELVGYDIDEKIIDSWRAQLSVEIGAKIKCENF